jgi:hypothetical protein
MTQEWPSLSSLSGPAEHFGEIARSSSALFTQSRSIFGIWLTLTNWGFHSCSQELDLAYRLLVCWPDSWLRICRFLSTSLPTTCNKQNKNEFEHICWTVQTHRPSLLQGAREGWAMAVAESQWAQLGTSILQESCKRVGWRLRCEASNSNFNLCDSPFSVSVPQRLECTRFLSADKFVRTTFVRTSWRSEVSEICH